MKNRGMSLIEVSMAVGLTAFLSYNGMRVFNEISKMERDIDHFGDFNITMAKINKALSDKAVCDGNLAGQTVSDTDPDGAPINAIFLDPPANTQALYSVGDAISQDYTIGDMSVRYRSQNTVSFFITFTKNPASQNNGLQNVVRSVSLSTNFDTGTFVLNSCFVNASGDLDNVVAKACAEITGKDINATNLLDPLTGNCIIPTYQEFTCPGYMLGFQRVGDLYEVRCGTVDITDSAPDFAYRYNMAGVGNIENNPLSASEIGNAFGGGTECPVKWYDLGDPLGLLGRNKNIYHTINFTFGSTIATQCQ